MLTGYQCEVVAYLLNDSGEFLCEDCTKAQLNEIEFAKLEAGIADYIGSPFSRYSLDESNSERVYEYASEIASERGIAHDDYTAIDNIVEELGDSLDEVCGDCGAHLG